MKKRLLTQPNKGIIHKRWSRAFAPLFMLLFAATFNMVSAQFAFECNCYGTNTYTGGGVFAEAIIFPIDDEIGPWTISAVEGLYNFDAGIPLVSYQVSDEVGSSFDSQEIVVEGLRREGTDYSISITNGTETFTYSSMQSCSYPATDIIGNAGPCVEGDNEMYNIDSEGTISNIAWTLAGGGSIVGASDQEEVEIDWDDNPGEYALMVTGDLMVNGNSCPFTRTLDVYISSDQSPTLACNGTLNLSIGGNCELEVNADVFLEDMQLGEGAYELIIRDTEADTIVPGPMIGMEYLGKQLEVTVAHPCSGNSCWGYLVVEDKSMPNLECPEDVTLECDADFSPEAIGYPLPEDAIVTEIGERTYNVQGFDGCSDVTLYYDDRVEAALCTGEFATTVKRTWRAEDTSGNVDTCSQNISVMRGSLMVDITFPGSWDDVLGPNPSLYPCDDYPKDEYDLPHPDYTGYPTGNYCMNVEISYTDQVIPKCGDNSYKVRRRWVVTDVCGIEDPIVRTQYITVHDTEAPIINAPEDFTVGTESLDCVASITVPTITDITDCSETTYSVAWKPVDDSGDPFTGAQSSGVTYVGGQYHINDITATQVWLVYTVEDACHNISQDYTTVTVDDLEQPVPVCDLKTFVGLTEEGDAYADIWAFDDGSYDNCALESLEVRRLEKGCNETSVFGHEVKFCCEDIGTPVMVILQATDAAGNTNQCMVEVEVQDNKAPEFTFCPNDRTVDCGTLLVNLDQFGTPTAVDNCNVEIEETREDNLNECGVGTVIRTFRAFDPYGNEAYCQQVIRVQPLTPFGYNNIDWPDNYSTDNGCPGLGIAPDMLPVNNARPRIISGDDFCSKIAMDYDDVVYQHVEDYCFKVLRTWTVFDHCQFDPSVPGSGEFTRTQLIQVRNTTAPTFTRGCREDAVQIEQLANCIARVTLSAEATDDCELQDIDFEYEIDIDNDGTIDIQDDGNYIDRVMDYGTHRVIWYATDECSNTTQCENVFTVSDQKAPTPYCYGEVVTTFNDDGYAEIWASDFDKGSGDLCSEEVTFSFNPQGTEPARTYTCDDLTAQITTLEVDVYVIDADGNYDNCTALLKLQDNLNLCGLAEEEERVAISGNVRMANETDLAEVEVMIMNMGSEEAKYDMTNDAGAYAFSELGMYTDYYVEPTPAKDYSKGVSTLDVVLIQRHILGLQEFDSPYQVIAADANNSESVSAADVVQLRKLVLGIYDELPDNTSWRFVDAAHQFNEVDNPWPFQEKINVDQIDHNMTSVDFIGVKVGDVNGTYEQELNGNVETENRSTVALTAINTDLKRGDAYHMAIRTDEDMSVAGLQMALTYNPELVTFTGVSAGSLTVSSNNVHVNELTGTIKISIDAASSIEVDANLPMFQISFIAKKATEISKAVAINDRAMTPEIYLAHGQNVVAENIQFNIENRDGASEVEPSFYLMQNVPNPFDNNTTISFTLPQASEASLKVYDYTGKLLYEKLDEYQKGMNHITLDINDIQATGILYYQLDTKTHSASKKMIVIR